MRKTVYGCVRSLRPCTASMQMLRARWCTSQLPTRARISLVILFFLLSHLSHTRRQKVGLGGTNSDERRRKVENKLAFVVL